MKIPSVRKRSWLECLSLRPRAPRLDPPTDKWTADCTRVCRLPKQVPAETNFGTLWKGADNRIIMKRGWSDELVFPDRHLFAFDNRGTIWLFDAFRILDFYLASSCYHHLSHSVNDNLEFGVQWFDELVKQCPGVCSSSFGWLVLWVLVSFACYCF